MYKVFFVDDEIIVREGVRTSINWTDTNFTLVGEAPDGEIALSMIQEIKPDILVTDIKMPFMDGLELSTKVKKNLPWIKIIILSGHDEFNYAKKAISIGVEEYLLKPFSANDLMQALEKVSHIIDKENQEHTTIKAFNHDKQSNDDLNIDQWFSDLIVGLHSTDKVLSEAEKYNVNLDAKYFSTIIFQVDTHAENYKELLTIKSILAPITKNWTEANLFSISMDKLVLLICDDNSKNLEEKSFTYAQAIKHEIEIHTSCTTTAIISNIVDKLLQISKAYTDADRMLFTLGPIAQGKITSFNDIQSKQPVKILELSGDPLTDRLQYSTLADVEKIAKEYLDLLNENNVQFMVMSYYLFVDIIVSCSKIITKLGGQPNLIIPDVLQQENIMQAVSTKENFKISVQKLLERVIQFRDSNMGSKYTDIISKAKQYIETHYADPNISLQSTANQVGFSPNHFSTIFSQETGTSFIDYLTSVRIFNAKKLLKSTNKRSTEIAYETGFNDPHYFSFIFKKHIGYTPTEYRNGKF